MKWWLLVILTLITFQKPLTWTVNISFYDNVLRVNNIEYPMVLVEGGGFNMGATEEQGEYGELDPNEKPIHRVTLTNYRIGKFEVTQELWEAVMGNNPSHFRGTKRPVEQVSWDDCQKFIRRLNDLTGKNFRLPTEAEWEFAARGGNKSNGYIFSGSDDFDEVAWLKFNSDNETHIVGTKSPNELGIYDMSGNVAEYCSDLYGKYSIQPQTNPTGAITGEYHVDRGGSWNDRGLGCRVSSRAYSPNLRFTNIGFRLCL